MILQGDCIEVMKAIKPNSIDAIVTDPPYGLEFMGKEWDKFGGKPVGKDYEGDGGIKRFFKGNKPIYTWNMGAFYKFNTQWLTEAYRVLKPGASMLVMGGTRTFHRLMVAIEDSGFIIKDTLMWIYGSGFPKAQDLGKMIDKRNGRNQETYKPFAEYLKRQRFGKNLSMSEMDKRLGTNTAYSWWEGRLSGIQLPTMEYYLKLKDILSLDDRFDKLIEREEAEREKIGETKQTYPDNHWMASNFADGQTTRSNLDISNPSTDLAKHWHGFKVGGIKPAYEPIIWAVKPPEGSYIDNVLKWGVGAVNVDECRVEHTEPAEVFTKRTSDKFGGNSYNNGKKGHFRNDDNLASPSQNGRFPANVILDEEAGRMLDEQSGELKSGGRKGLSSTSENRLWPLHGGACKSSNGGASRFFYCAKASKAERGDDNSHPTVKPIALFEYLIKLVTRKGQVILDPFLGSGTTAIAADKAGRKCVGIDKENDYLEIVKRRIDFHNSQPKQLELDKE